jgi:acyl carrier protein
MTIPASAPVTPDPEITPDSARGWLLDRLAVYLRRPAETIDPLVPLAEYGMDSVCALSLCGDLEDVFGLEEEPTLMWDHPTVESLVRHITAELSAAELPAGELPAGEGQRR